MKCPKIMGIAGWDHAAVGSFRLKRLTRGRSRSLICIQHKLDLQCCRNSFSGLCFRGLWFACSSKVKTFVPPKDVSLTMRRKAWLVWQWNMARACCGDDKQPLGRIADKKDQRPKTEMETFGTLLVVAIEAGLITTFESKTFESKITRPQHQKRPWLWL